MEHKIAKSVFYLTLCMLFFYTSYFSQSIKIDAGVNQFVNWEKTKSTQLNGSISSGKVKTEWTCTNNPKVVLKNASSLKTDVTFPRPGYYLFVLSAKGSKKPVGDSVAINVYKPNSHSERVTDIINLITVDEKIKQLTNESDSIPRLGISKYNYWSEALHGVLTTGATSFPQAIGIGATWDPDLVYRIASTISDEARVKNITTRKGLTYWSPTINIARDPRWGRNEESYSEDPYLLSRMGVSFIKGMQGDHPYYFKTIATPKHFIANNEEERRHTGSSDVDLRSLWEYYMPAFNNAIVEGKAFSIMGAYNELNQVPCNANSYLMTDILRRKWGFEGFVVSDCGAINDMINGHHFFETGAEAAARSIRAGCDVSCGDEYRLYIKEALDKGLLEEKDLDRALERVLTARFRLGEFDPPELVPFASISTEKLDSKENRELALEAARKSIVLLKNEGILPLRKGDVESIAVIGPNASEAQLGIYSGTPNVKISPLDGIKTKAEALGIKVEYTMGCSIGGGLLRPIESKYFAKVEGSDKKGIKGDYFDNNNLSGQPVLTRIDSMIDFSFGSNSPTPGLPIDKFSIRWKGKIIPPGKITRLGTRTDDGARLYLDGKLIIDDWTDHGEKLNTADVTLQAGKEYEVVFETYDNGLGAAARLVWDLEQKDFSTAIKVAEKNDVVVLVLGISPGLAEEELDRTTIELPKTQRDLIDEVSQANPNIIVVLINGGPVALAGMEDYAEAIVEAWYPGQAGGTAIADVLFGDVNPGGKLPQTFYASTKQLPPAYDYDLINHPRTYLYFNEPVLYPFGYGLSYTEFNYSNLKLNAGKIKKDSEIEIKCTIENTGEFTGDEVVQVYVRDLDASVKVPIRQLKRFQRVTLKPDEEKTLIFKIPASELSFYDIKTNDYIVEPGQFEIQVGSSSQDIRLRDTFIVE